MAKVKDCRKCDGCPLQRLFPESNFVPPQIGPSLRLLVGEAPGETEALEGRPFVGGSGKTLDSLLRKAGIRRDDLTIINTIQCQPLDNLYPTDGAARRYCSEQEGEEAVRHCYREYVAPILNERPWTRIDACGEKSLRTLTGLSGIMKWRGSPLPLLGEKVPKVISILHPSFLMRSQYLIPATISDLKKGLQPPPEFYNLKPTLDELRDFRNADQLCFDLESNGFTGNITMVGLSLRPYYVTVVPFRGSYISELKEIFATAKSVVGQNIIGFDIPKLAQSGITIPNESQIWDIMLMQHLVQPDMDHDLEFISSIFTQKPAWKHLSGANMELYCARDVDVTLQAFLQLKGIVKFEELENLYKYVQVPLAKICRMMSDTGIRTDGNRLVELRTRFLAEQEALEVQLPPELKAYDKSIRIRKPAPKGTLGKSGKPVKFIHVEGTERVTPWNSPRSVEKYLYETLGLPKQLHRKTKKVTTDKNSLERLYRKLLGDKKREHALRDAGYIDALGKVKKLDELLSTFLKDCANAHVSKTIHAGFLVHGTATGRLSSSNPNMQNIPANSRYIYVPPYPDWCFIEADFSSLENRLAAWYANDTDRLARLAVPGFNEHKWLTSQIYGIPEKEVSKDSWQYKRGKNTNHGADGAMGPRMFSMTYNIPEKDARDLIFKWRTINKKSAEWQERVGNQACHDGILTNPFGRKRWFWSTSSYTEGIRFLPQSGGADICYRAMIAMLYKRINWLEENVLKISSVLAPLPEPAQLVLQVHDSLLVACPKELVNECIAAMRMAMCQQWDQLGGFSIPVEFKVGKPGMSWGELETIK